MADTKPIRSENDYDAALARIDELMDAEPGSAAGRELDVLADLVELYEGVNEPRDIRTSLPRDRVPHGTGRLGRAT